MEPTPSIPSFDSPQSQTASVESPPMEKLSLTSKMSWNARIKIGLAALLPLLAISFGGSREPWILSSVILALGVMVVVFPMQTRVRRIWLILGATFLALTGYQCLPFLRTSLPLLTPEVYDLLQLQPPPTLSLQPWVSFEQWIGLFACVVWWWWCISQNFSEKQKRLGIQLVAVCITLLAIVSMVVKFKGMSVPLWQTEWDYNYFGPFPNKNHFSALLASSALLLLSAAFDAFHRRKRYYLAYALGILPVFSAILVSNSRAAIVLLFIGMVFWMFAGRFHRASIQRMALITVALLLLASAFVSFGTKLVQRFVSGGSVLDTLASEPRWNIYSSSFELLKKSPLSGSGLGNFEPSFAIFESLPGWVYRTLHPESDWFWLAIEAGIPAMLVALTILGLILTRAGFFKASKGSRKSHRRLRTACWIVVVIFAIHGIIDVPLHHLGNATLLGLFAAMALPNRRSDESLPAYSKFRFAMPILGFLVILLGGAYLLNSQNVLTFPSTAQFEHRMRAAEANAKTGDYASAEAHLTEALRFKPLQWNAYFQRGMFQLKRNGSLHDAALDFARARTLERQNIPMCFREGDAWMKIQPERSMPAWRAILDRSYNAAPLNYSYILQRLVNHPSLRLAAKNFATTQKLQLVYLLYLPKEEFIEELEHYKDSRAFFMELSDQEKYRFFEAWYERGDRAELIQRIRDNKAWAEIGWPFLSRELASQGKFQEAYDYARPYVKAPFMHTHGFNTNLTDARRSYNSNPNDLIRALTYYEALNHADKYTEALALILEIEQLPERPHKVIYDVARSYSRINDYPKAYQYLMDYYELIRTVK